MITELNPEHLTELFMAGRYDEIVAEISVARPDLSDNDLTIELCLALIKTFAKSYAALRTAIEEATLKIDGTLLIDPYPQSGYVEARDMLLAALDIV